MRRAFADALYDLARDDERVVLLTGDLGFGVFDRFKEDFGPRYVNVGVAEAQLIDCAAGMALEGFRPIAYSIASFATGRCFEQIRVAVGYHDAPGCRGRRGRRLHIREQRCHPSCRRGFGADGRDPGDDRGGARRAQ